MADHQQVYLTTDELSKRWDIPVGTLNHWRCRGQGAPFVKIEKHIRYRLSDVEAFEQGQTRGGNAA